MIDDYGLEEVDQNWFHVVGEDPIADDDDYPCIQSKRHHKQDDYSWISFKIQNERPLFWKH